MERVKDRNKIKGLKDGQERTREWLVISYWLLVEKTMRRNKSKKKRVDRMFGCLGIRGEGGETFYINTHRVTKSSQPVR